MLIEDFQKIACESNRFCKAAVKVPLSRQLVRLTQSIEKFGNTLGYVGGR